MKWPIGLKKTQNTCGHQKAGKEILRIICLYGIFFSNPISWIPSDNADSEQTVAVLGAIERRLSTCWDVIIQPALVTW